MKKIFLALLLFINATAFSQVIVNRAGPANTVIDQRLGGARNFILPRYNTLALADADLGLDLCGAMIYCLEDNSIYHRQCSPKAWVKMGSSANGGNGVCGLQNGGLVTWSGTGLTYDVTSAAYCINSNGYYFGGGQITLDAAPTTNNRFDVLVLDNTGSLVKITGTENVNPQVPSINPATQIYLTAILVTPGGGAGTQSVIWDENTGAPEWIASAVGTWTSTNFNSTTTPYHGAIVSEGIGANGVYATGGSGFRYADAAAGITASDYNALKFFIKNQSPVNNAGNFTVVLVTDNNGAGNKIPITLAQSFGYNKNSTSWQNITIPLTNFGVFAPGEKINRIELRFFNSADLAVTYNFLVDYITMQGGVNNPGAGGNFVTNVFRVPGTDSVKQTKNGMDYFAYLDSVGSGSIPNLQQVTDQGNYTTNGISVFNGVAGVKLLDNYILGNDAGLYGIYNDEIIAVYQTDGSYYYANGKIISTADSTTFSHKVKIVDGTEAAGKVFTSDANGLGSWQDAGGGSASDLQTVTNIDSVTTHKITAANFKATAIPVYENNAAAVTAGLLTGDIYYLPYNNGSYQTAVAVVPPYVPPAPDFWKLGIDIPSGETAFIGFNNVISLDIDWGDGTIENYTSGYTASHVYVSGGSYEIKISGSLTGALGSYVSTYDNNDDNGLFGFLTSVSPIGGITGITSFDRVCYGASNLTSVPSNLFSFYPTVQAFNNSFTYCSSLVSNVPELWITNPLGENFRTFFGCDGAANYADIPDSWKGL